MAQPANTFATNDAIGIREDLSDIIYNVDPTDTPFFSMCSKVKASNTYHEWQTDTLVAASSANQVVEGNDPTIASTAATTRLGNYCEIAEKTARITNTQEAVTKAGRANEMAYQIVKRTKELRRDMESSLLANKARNAGTDVTARQSAGIDAWYTTNTSAGSGGSDPTTIGSTARTDGTQRAFTEALLKTVIQSAWSNGGSPSVLMLGAFNKQVFSGFTGSSTRMDVGEDKKVVAAVDVYVSDFGTINAVPNRFQRARDAHLLQKDMWAVASLRGVKNKPLAVTGDHESRMINVEFCLEARNEQASGLIADLTTS